MKDQSCPICQCTSFDTVLNCDDFAVSRETFQILRCNACEFLLTYPQPLPQQLSKYYESGDYSSHVGRANSAIDRIYQTVRRFAVQWKLKLITSRIPFRLDKALLDYGCGTAEFLKAAKRKEWKTIGMEPSEIARENASPEILKDIKQSLKDIEDLKMHFDVITLWHVLEHIEDLNETITKLKDMLKENGFLFIAVPNHKSWDSNLYQKFWAAYDVPRHLWHFDKKSMEMLATKHGLKIAKIVPMWLDAFYICLLSEKYSSPKTFFVTRLFRALLNGIKSNRNARISTEYSSLIYVLTK